MVMMVMKVWFVHFVIELAAWHRGSGQTGIHAGLVECQRILGYEHADVREDRSIVFGMAITVRRDVQNERNVEMGTSVDDCLGIFSHFVVQQLGRMIVGGGDGDEGAASTGSA